MLGMPLGNKQIKHTENLVGASPDFHENYSKEDFLSRNAGMTISWNVKPKYNSKGEQAIHQRLKKKLEDRKNKQK